MEQASYRAALLSAGCALNVADEILCGQVGNQFLFHPFNTERCRRLLQSLEPMLNLLPRDFHYSSKPL